MKALPYYTLLPIMAFILHYFIGDRIFSFTVTCMYWFIVEFMVFFDHYLFLHKWNTISKHMKHNVHHAFRKKRDISAWVAFAFYPLDGLSQGMPLLYAALIVPVSWNVVYVSILIVGIWTVCIHTNSFKLPYPLMGCDYHLIHHERNWYNFGLFTVIPDTLFGTIRYPLDSP